MERPYILYIKMKENRYSPLIVFFVIFLAFVLGDRFLGNGYRGSLTPVESLTWKEIYSSIGEYLIISLLLTFGILQIIKKAKKVEAKNMENARKRIEEKERKGKERKEKGSKSDNQEIK